MSIISTNRASYQNTKKIGFGTGGKKSPIASKKHITLLTEIANTCRLMTEASTVAAYTLRLSHLNTLLREFRNTSSI